MLCGRNQPLANPKKCSGPEPDVEPGATCVPEVAESFRVVPMRKASVHPEPDTCRFWSLLQIESIWLDSITVVSLLRPK